MSTEMVSRFSCTCEIRWATPTRSLSTASARWARDVRSANCADRLLASFWSPDNARTNPWVASATRLTESLEVLDVFLGQSLENLVVGFREKPSWKVLAPARPSPPFAVRGYRFATLLDRHAEFVADANCHGARHRSNSALFVSGDSRTRTLPPRRTPVDAPRWNTDVNTAARSVLAETASVPRRLNRFVGFGDVRVLEIERETILDANPELLNRLTASRPKALVVAEQRGQVVLPGAHEAADVRDLEQAAPWSRARFPMLALPSAACEDAPPTVAWILDAPVIAA